MKASLKNYRQSPRKVRLVAKSVLGKRVNDAMLTLSFMPKRAADPLKSLISSAVANATNSGAKTEDLVITSLRVDKGIVLKRMMPRARGSAYRINKRTSHVTVVLGEKADKKSRKSKEKTVSVKEEKTVKAKKKVTSKKKVAK